MGEGNQRLIRIRVDRVACSGHARCFAAAPELYTVDELGFSDIGQLQVSAAMAEAAHRGAAACPERAITVEVVVP